MNPERRLAEIEGYVNRRTGKPRANVPGFLEAMRAAMFRAWLASPRCRRCHWPDESVAFSRDLCSFCEGRR